MRILSIPFCLTVCLPVRRSFACFPGGSTRLREPYLSFLLKQTLVRIALLGLRALRGLGRGVRVFFVYALAKPLTVLGRGLFHLILLPVYSTYGRLKRKLKTHPRLVGILSIEHFFQRYALYILIVLTGVFGVTTNLVARTIRPDEIGRDVIWSELAQGEDDELIIETGVKRPAGTSLAAVGGPALLDVDTAVEAPAVSQNVENLAAVSALESAATTGPRQVVESYAVQGGDTISTIAERYGVSSRTILWANGMSDADFIKPGQSLKIPSETGYLYTVKSGDTLAKIAQTYKGKEDEILAANNLPLAEAIQSGQEIIIPGGEPPAPPTPAPSRTLLQQVFVRGDNPPPSVSSSSARFIWPTPSRRINQYYRGRFHTGLDIDGEYSSPIYAAAGGRVTYASADRSGYGLHVTIDHGNGFSTLYAHASKVFVRSGQSVSQGQTIAMQGCTGRCSGVHLHYEIRLRGAPLNPFSYY